MNMVVPKKEKHNVQKYDVLSSLAVSKDVSNQSQFRLISQVSVLISLFAVFALSALLGFYIGHIKKEMNKMADTVQRNQMEIAELYSELRHYRTDAFDHVAPVVKDIIRNTVQKSDKERVRRSSSMNGSFLAAHLYGTSDRNNRRTGLQQPQPGNFFHWSPADPNAFSLMVVVNDDSGTFISITEEGFYFVYSQVTYRGHGLMDIGHSTVCVKGDSSEELMSSINTQQMASAKSGKYNRRRSIDSSFHSGVFYFYSGDRIGVRPWNYAGDHLYSTDQKKSFLGAYFLHE